MSEERPSSDADPGRGRREDPPRGDAAGDLRALEERLGAAERARELESEELLTRMGAIEVLIDHLNGRIGELASQVAEAKAGGQSDGAIPEELELRIGGLEHAADAMAPLTGVPATIAALEQELILLGRRLDATSREAEARSELVSREIEARIAVSEAEIGVRHGEAWEGMQESVSAESRRARSAERSIEERLAEQTQAATAALADLEGRITSSLEGLAGRMGSATSASGTLAESMVGRLELLERDIAEIESRFEGIAARLASRGSGGPGAGTAPGPGSPSPAPAPPAGPPQASPTPPAPAPPPAGQAGPGQRADKPRPRSGPPRPGPLPPSPPPAAPGPGPAQEPAGPVNLNEASFEMLRSLGCSVTQTARILSARKVRGGFSSPEELADVPGLPAEFRKQLISRLTV